MNILFSVRLKFWFIIYFGWICYPCMILLTLYAGDLESIGTLSYTCLLNVGTSLYNNQKFFTFVNIPPNFFWRVKSLDIQKLWSSQW